MRKQHHDERYAGLAYAAQNEAKGDGDYVDGKERCGDIEQPPRSGLNRLCKGRTVLVIAHRLGSIRNAAQIVVMQDGQLEACGTHEELGASCALYRRLWAAWNTERTAEHPAGRLGMKEAAI